MAKKMAKTVIRIDRYGRVLIPKEVRGRLGLRQGSSLEITVRGNEVILRRVDTELNQHVEEWVKFIDQSAPTPFLKQIRGGDSKWLSREYCMRKLGL